MALKHSKILSFHVKVSQPTTFGTNHSEHTNFTFIITSVKHDIGPNSPHVDLKYITKSFLRQAKVLSTFYEKHVNGRWML